MLSGLTVGIMGISLLIVIGDANATPILWSAQSPGTVIISKIDQSEGFNFSAGRGINDSGQVAGMIDFFVEDGWGFTHAAVWNPDKNSFTDLGTLDGPKNHSRAIDISNNGKVTGQSYAAGSTTIEHAFIWDPGTNTMTDLGTLGGSYSWGLEINDFGQVVGESGILNNSGFFGGIHAFVWENGTMYDLHSIVPFLTIGETISSIYSLNNLSQIVAGSNLGSTYLLTPTTTSSAPSPNQPPCCSLAQD